VTTSTTGRQTKRRAGRRHDGRGAFTLLELVLVMMVICTVLAMAAPSLRGFFASRKTADTASNLVALTQLARSQAIAEGTPYRLNIDAESGRYWVTMQDQGAFVPLTTDFGRIFQMPDGVQADLKVDGAGPNRDYVTFFPDGRTEPAVIRLRGLQGDRANVECDAPAETFRVVSPKEGDDR